MKKITGLIALATTMAGAAYGEGDSHFEDLIKDIPRMIEMAKANFNQEDCVPFIKHYADQIFNHPSGYYYPGTKADVATLLKESDSVLANMIELRLTVQSKFKSFKAPSRECIDGVRQALRIGRFAEEALIDWIDQQKSHAPAFGGIFSEPWPYSFQALGPSPSPLTTIPELKTGDVLLIRGQTFISATIARIGDADSQFSHLAIVGESPGGEKYLIEALIETGTIKTKLSEYLKNKETRFAVYRYKDSEIAKKAGQMIYEKANAFHMNGQNIPYDFSMNPKDHGQIFCAELVQWAYELATNNALAMPKYPTSYSRLKNSKFLDDLGMRVNETFAPADIELQPDFSLVAEWRYIPVSRKIKIQDAIFTAIFDWIENRGYELQADPVAMTEAQLAKLIRSTGLFSNLMQRHMDPKILYSVIRLRNLARVLEGHMFDFEQKYYDIHGHSLTFKDLLTELERFRREDCDSGSAQGFHWILKGPGACN